MECGRVRDGRWKGKVIFWGFFCTGFGLSKDINNISINMNDNMTDKELKLIEAILTRREDVLAALD